MNKKNEDKKQEEEQPSKFRKAYNDASEDIKDNLEDVRDKVILPTVRLGKNRFVAAGMAAKSGAVIGGKTGFAAGPKGALGGAFLGAVVAGAAGFALGPKVNEKLEKWIEPEDKANDNNKKDTPSSKPPSNTL